MLYRTGPVNHPTKMTPHLNIYDPAYDTRLGGLWDDLKTAVTGAIGGTVGEKLKSELKDQISDAQAKLESKLGAFLASNQAVRELKARAQAQQNSDKAEVQSRATAVVGKANGLLSQYDSIRAQALSLATQLADLKNRLDTSEVFKFSNPLDAGSRIVDLFSQNKNEILSATSAAYATFKRMEDHMKQVGSLNSDVLSLESYAQGKGWQAIGEQIGGGATGIYKTLGTVAVLGLGAYFLVPTLLRRR